jgi:hypothetical protein
MIITLLGITNIQAQPTNIQTFSSKQFGFQISYPDTWQSTQAAPGAAFTIMKENKTAGISVNIANFKGDKTSFMKEMETKSFRDSLLLKIQKSFPDAKVINYKKTILGNFPAYLFAIEYSIKNLDTASEMRSVQIFCIYEKRMYSINFESPKIYFNERYREFERILSSFIFR